MQIKNSFNDIEKLILSKLLNHYSLNEEECHNLLLKIIKGEYNMNSVAAIISLLSFKGETKEELLGFSKALNGGMKKFNTAKTNLMDIVGTGGDNKNTFNISTVSALLMSSLGVSIAKEVKPCVSSKCGSSDLLTALNIKIDASFEARKKCLDQENFVFINIPDYYPNISSLFELENELGSSTIVSLLPPICHPAMVSKIIIGANDRQKATLIYEVISQSHLDKAYILWNDEGYDELVPIGTTKILVFEKNKEKRELSLTANDFSLSGNYKNKTKIPGGNVKENLKIIDEINKCTPGIILDTVIMNTVLGLRLANLVQTLKEGTEIVKNALKKNILEKKIKELSKITNTI